jgi:hypothetical protein
MRAFLRPIEIGLSVAFLASLGVLGGCGAKTGLKVPELDAEVTPDAAVDAAIPCIEIPLDGGPVNVALQVKAEVGRADVVFLIDTTLSMDDEIDQIRRRLRDRIVPAIRSAIPDSEVAVATFGDFPRRPYGLADVDLPFRLMSPRTADITQVQAAVDAIRLGDGRDAPEGQVEALFQLATGAGIAPYVPANLGCPMGGLGYACLRNDALPVVLLFTDAEMHDGPGGSNPYDPGVLGVVPHRFDEAMAALTGLGAKVIGFDSGSGVARADLEAVAAATGTLGTRGDPLVYDIGPRGGALDTQVVSAIETFAGSLIQDIDAVPIDPDPSDGTNVLDYVESVRPLRADPPTGIGGIDEAKGVFLDVQAGTELSFRIEVRAGAIVPGTEPLVLRLRVVFRGDEKHRLGSEDVYLIIPAADGSGCGDVVLTNDAVSRP